MRRMITLLALLTLWALPAAAQEAPPLGAHGLRLPASFTGTLPCADCEGIVHHLDLWPNQIYHLRRVWQGREAPLTRDEVGRWYADPARDALVLHGASEAPLFWQVRGPDRLRQMDLQGQPIDSDLPLELTGLGGLQETDLTLPLQGLFTYFADAALIEICLTGERFPVAMEGDYLALEKAYSAARPEPGAPVMAVLDATLTLRPAMEGPDRRSVVVDRFLRLGEDNSCARHRAPAALENTYWRIVSLNGTELTPQPDRREPHLVLLAGDAPRFRATVGCNTMGGGFERSGETGLRLLAGMSTLMACPPPLMEWEQTLGAVLGEVRQWEIAGQALILRDDSGAPRIQLEAVYLP